VWHCFIGNRRNVDNGGGGDNYYVDNDNDDIHCADNDYHNNYDNYYYNYYYYNYNYNDNYNYNYNDGCTCCLQCRRSGSEWGKDLF
jgi:hypothetical protein